MNNGVRLGFIMRAIFDIQIIEVDDYICMTVGSKFPKVLQLKRVTKTQVNEFEICED